MSERDFIQRETTLSKILSKEVTLNHFLEIVNIEGKPADFAFYIHSQSMTAAVILLSDESIMVTHRLYCWNDPVVLIFIRDAKDPSPNSSACPSHESSLRSRMNTARSRGKLLPDLFIRPQARHVSGSTDVATMAEIKDESEMITVLLDFDDSVTFSKEYLICLYHSLFMRDHGTDILTSRLDYLSAR